MLTFCLLVPLIGLQACAEPEPESWPWDTVFEWEVNYWEWLGDERGKTDRIPKNAQMIVGVKLYEKFGHHAYARVDVGKEATLRVALVPYDMDRSLGLLTKVQVGIFRPQPQNGSRSGWRHKTGYDVATKNWKFGERIVFGGMALPGGGKKQAYHAFSLTIRKCEQDKKGLIKDYFENPSSPEHEDEVRRLQTLPQGGAGRPDKKP